MLEVCISLAIEVVASDVKLDRLSFDVEGFAIRLSVWQADIEKEAPTLPRPHQAQPILNNLYRHTT